MLLAWQTSAGGGLVARRKTRNAERVTAEIQPGIEGCWSQGPASAHSELLAILNDGQITRAFVSNARNSRIVEDATRSGSCPASVA